MIEIRDKRVRVLVVDDSALNRRVLADAFGRHDGIEVVGLAADGNEALRMAYDLNPDVITLDLEMPKMDGFSFLRVLMGSRPTPIIVVSSYSHKENVFHALELGAVDFVAKPDGGSTTQLRDGLDPLLQKVLMFQPSHPVPVNVRPSTTPPMHRREMPTLVEAPRMTPRHIIGIVASTGGPTSLTELFTTLSPSGSYAVMVAQHMPDRFTKTFAERLHQKSLLDVSEAKGGELITTQTAFVCPGRQCMELSAKASGGMKTRVMQPDPEDKYIPSGNRLLTSIARAVGSRAIGVVLTGMGDDGMEGARAIYDAGGVVIAESEETAVIYGMPRAVVRAGVATETLPLGEIAHRLSSLVR